MLYCEGDVEEMSFTMTQLMGKFPPLKLTIPMPTPSFL